jgi:hypothetical protein
MRILAAAIALIVFAVACERKVEIVPQPDTPPAKPAEPAKKKSTISAPKSIPADLKARVETEWPKIEAEGKLFMDAFDAARKANKEGNRDELAKQVEIAKKHFNNALEKWNEIYYSVDDIADEQLAEKCRRWLRKWNKQVDAWTSKAKGLKEFSRVK